MIFKEMPENNFWAYIWTLIFLFAGFMIPTAIRGCNEHNKIDSQERIQIIRACRDTCGSHVVESVSYDGSGKPVCECSSVR